MSRAAARIGLAMWMMTGSAAIGQAEPGDRGVAASEVAPQTAPQTAAPKAAAPPQNNPRPQTGAGKSMWPEPGTIQLAPGDVRGNAQSNKTAPTLPNRRPILPVLPPDPTFSEAELLAGKRITEAECAAQSSSVWVTVGNTGECVAYFHSAAGKAATVADALPSVVVFLSGDEVTVNGRGETKALPFYVKTTPHQLQADSDGWSGRLRRPYLMIARPGTYGSSGNHAERRSEREIAVVSAALDAIKERYAYQRLHLAGYGEGAHTAAMLMTRRDDLGCVVLASGLLSVKQHLSEVGRSVDWTGNKKPLDPIDTPGQIRQTPDLRVVVLTDPDDLVISARSQTAYVHRMDKAKVQQIFAAAPDPAAHGLLHIARQVAGDCAAGMQDEPLRKKYENKVPDEAPDAADPPLHRPDALRRELSITEAQCAALKTALWLTVEGRKLCIRYWISTAGRTWTQPLVFFDGDLGSNDNGRLALNAAAARISGGQLQRMANLWSRNYGGPYVQLARVGTFGSSGSHSRDRATEFEIQVAMAALDALKTKYGWSRLHVVGQSGGGHTAAALARHRDDIGCAVMASGGIALKIAHSRRGFVLGNSITSKYDPYDRILDRPYPTQLRMIVMSDPADRIVSYSSQAAFVQLVRLQKTSILHLLTDASDKEHHGLSAPGIRAAADCAKGVSDQELVKTYHNTTARVAYR